MAIADHNKVCLNLLGEFDDLLGRLAPAKSILRLESHAFQTLDAVHEELLKLLLLTFDNPSERSVTCGHHGRVVHAAKRNTSEPHFKASAAPSRKALRPSTEPS